jgi:hypothetical protein
MPKRMIRAAAACVFAALVATGCGSSSMTACGPGGTPPTPRIRAHLQGGRIRIDYEVPARPADCRPVAILVTAHSVDKLDNIAPGSGAGGPIRLEGDSGRIVLKVPPLDLPPYEALASTYTDRGRRSPVTKVRIPQSGDYCRRSASAEFCIAQAQTEFERCVRGELPRNRCVDWIWRTRPPIPYEPLVGVTRAGLEKSFAYTEERVRRDPPLRSVVCRGLRMCVATWRGFRARYEVSGYGQREGCWIAERREVLAETPTAEHVTPLRYVIPERTSGCVDWVR